MQGTRLRLFGACAAILCLTVLLDFPTAAEDQLVLPGPFALIDGDGHTVRSTDFPGKWLLIYFGYTQCSDQSPTSLSTIAEALEQIGPAAQFIEPLFITVDPERDKGPTLKSFTAAFDPRMIGLGGTPEDIARLAKTLGINYEKVLTGDPDDSYVIDHSTTLTLIEPSGRGAETFAMAEPYQLAAKLVAA